MTNKGRRRKRQVSEREEDEDPVDTATEKSCKRKRQSPEFKEVQRPSN